MISLNHVLAGTAIGLAVKQPALVAVLAFLSHFVLDAIPHYDYGDRPGTKLWWKIWTVDAVTSFLAIALLALAVPELAWAVIAGGICGELPDVFWVYYLKSGKPAFWFFRFHAWIQWSETSRGLYYELGYVLILVMLNIWLLPK